MATTYRDNGRTLYSGTEAERLAYTIETSDTYEKNVFWLEPNGNEYRVIEGAWVQTKAAGAQGFVLDAAKVNIASQADLDSEASITHVAAGTAATGSSIAGSWVDSSDYDKGIIIISLIDGAPAGDLAGEFQIQYSLDAGVTETPLETLVAVANIGVDDTQTLIVDLSSIKNAPYFKVAEAVTGTLTSVTYGVDVYLSRFRG